MYIKNKMTKIKTKIIYRMYMCSCAKETSKHIFLQEVKMWKTGAEM